MIRRYQRGSVRKKNGNYVLRYREDCFTPDGKAVAYAFRDKDADNLWMQPLDGSAGKQLTNFNSERIGDFHWSFDGSKLGLVRGHTDSDVVLIRDSRQ